MQTGIYIRARDKDGNYKSFDIGDPALPFESLQLWLVSKDDEYLMRLIFMLLGKEAE